MVTKTLRNLHYWLAAMAILLGLGVFGIAAASGPNSLPVYRAAMPVGYDVVLLKPAGTIVSFLGLIECPELEGAQQVDEGVHAKIVSADGRTLTHFPGDFSFRITASLRKTVITDASTKINNSQDPNDLLLALKFDLKVYDGMDRRSVQPLSVQMIGVPGDVPYDERVYRIHFDSSQIPVTDRFVLDVLSPDGEMLTRFHFDLL
jgi:hypothetical protein